MEIKVSTFYFARPLYKYMPRAVFDALEAAHKDGKEYAEVSDEDYYKMKKEAPAEIWADLFDSLRY